MAPERDSASDMRGIPRIFWAWAAVVVLLVALLVNVISMRQELSDVRNSVYGVSGDVRSSLSQLEAPQTDSGSADLDAQCRLLGALAKAQHIDVQTLLADASGMCADTLLGR